MKSKKVPEKTNGLRLLTVRIRIGREYVRIVCWKSRSHNVARGARGNRIEGATTQSCISQQVSRLKETGRDCLVRPFRAPQNPFSSKRTNVGVLFQYIGADSDQRTGHERKRKLRKTYNDSRTVRTTV